MYVCVCNAVTEPQIAQAIAQGATTVEQLRARLYTSTVCGACEPFVEECLARCLERRRTQAESVSA